MFQRPSPCSLVLSSIIRPILLCKFDLDPNQSSSRDNRHIHPETNQELCRLLILVLLRFSPLEYIQFRRTQVSRHHWLPNRRMRKNSATSTTRAPNDHLGSCLYIFLIPIAPIYI